MKRNSIFTTLAFATSFSLMIGGLSAGYSSGEEFDGCCPANNSCGELSFRADYLYWRTCTDGEVIALLQDKSESLADTGGNNSFAYSSYNEKNRVRHPSDTWDSGFRLGIGYRPSCKCYDVALNWTVFNPDRTKTIDSSKLSDSENTNIIPFPGFVLEKELAREFVSGNDFVISEFAGLQGTYVNGKYKLDLNLLDLEFGYRLQCGDCFSFRPHVDLRYASINQSLRVLSAGNIVIQTETESTEDLIVAQFDSKKRFKSDFCGVGPRVGFEATYELGCDWGVYGDAAISLLFGERKSKHKERASRFLSVGSEETSEALNSDDFHFHNKLKRDCTSAITDAEIGLYWNHSSCFCNSNYDFTFKLGWEHHYFFNQSAVDVARGSGLFKEENGDLSTQGLTVSIKVGF